MKIRPLQDRLIVKRLQEQERTEGGIIIPDAAKEKPVQGEVLAVGNGKISKYAGTEIKLDGEEHLMLREEDVLGVVET